MHNFLLIFGAKTQTFILKGSIPDSSFRLRVSTLMTSNSPQNEDKNFGDVSTLQALKRSHFVKAMRVSVAPHHSFASSLTMKTCLLILAILLVTTCSSPSQAFIYRGPSLLELFMKPRSSNVIYSPQPKPKIKCVGLGFRRDEWTEANCANGIIYPALVGKANPRM